MPRKELHLRFDPLNAEIVVSYSMADYPTKQSILDLLVVLSKETAKAAEKAHDKLARIEIEILDNPRIYELVDKPDSNGKHVRSEI